VLIPMRGPTVTGHEMYVAMGTGAVRYFGLNITVIALQNVI